MRAISWLVACAALIGCNGILGLDEAHLDPSLDTTGAGGGESGDGGEAGQRGSTAPETPCEQYCRVITEACSGENAQYTDLEACLTTCPLLPEGTPTDTEGNTLGCRLGYALKAPSEPITYCTWAGPGGDGMCGSNCEGFCTLMGATCTAQSTSAKSDYFASREACLNACAEVPQRGPYSATDESTTGGADIFECRLYHVAAAIYADDAAVHCPHAMGLRLCVDR